MTSKRYRGLAYNFIGGIGCALFPLESSVHSKYIESGFKKVLNSISPCIFSDDVNNQNRGCLDPNSVVTHIFIVIF